MKRVIGLIVNPVAGMGGSVGLKGTDGEMYAKALELGAEPVTPKRTNDLLTHIERKDAMTLLVAPGKMGERYVAGFDVPVTVIGEIGEETSPDDTKVVASAGKTMVLFSGGSKISDEDLLRKARICMEAGATGLIFGRNMWQRPYEEGLSITKQVREILLSS